MNNCMLCSYSKCVMIDAMNCGLEEGVAGDGLVELEALGNSYMEDENLS